MRIEFQNGEVYEGNSYEDPFMRGYNNNLYLRESCYTCDYANLDRVGDITIGDFWGIDILSSTSLSIPNGISLVKVNTVQGKKMIEMIKDVGLFEEHRINEATLRNQTLKKPMKKNANREEFFNKLGVEDFSVLSFRLTKNYSIKRKIESYRDRLLKGVINFLNIRKKAPRKTQV